MKFLPPVINTCLCPVSPGCDSRAGTAEMAGCRQACVCSEPAEPSLISPHCLGEASLHAAVHPNINEWKQGIASISEGRDGGNSQLFFLSFPLCLSLRATPPPALSYTLPGLKHKLYPVASVWLQIVSSAPSLSDCIIQTQKRSSVYPGVTPACGQSSPGCPAPAVMYSQFTVTRTCLTSAEATSLAALHSYLPDCSRVIPRISRYSSSPSNSLPGRTEKYKRVALLGFWIWEIAMEEQSQHGVCKQATVMSHLKVISEAVSARYQHFI